MSECGRYGCHRQPLTRRRGNIVATGRPGRESLAWRGDRVGKCRNVTWQMSVCRRKDCEFRAGERWCGLLPERTSCCTR